MVECCLTAVVVTIVAHAQRPDTLQNAQKPAFEFGSRRVLRWFGIRERVSALCHVNDASSCAESPKSDSLFWEFCEDLSTFHEPKVEIVIHF